MKYPPPPETERFILREVQHSDAPGFLALDSDSEVHRYLGGHTIHQLEEAKTVIAFLQQQYHDYGIGRWAVIDKTNGDFIGWAGIKWVTESCNGRTHYHDLGYRLQRNHWGKGIATECALACVKFAFEALRLPVITAAAHEHNMASRRVLEKCGFVQINKFLYDGSWHYWYEQENPKMRQS